MCLCLCVYVVGGGGGLTSYSLSFTFYINFHFNLDAGKASLFPVVLWILMCTLVWSMSSSRAPQTPRISIGVCVCVCVSLCMCVYASVHTCMYHLIISGSVIGWMTHDAVNPCE